MATKQQTAQKQEVQPEQETKTVQIEDTVYDANSIGTAGIELINTAKQIQALLQQKELDMKITKEAMSNIMANLKEEAKTFTEIEQK